MFLCGSACVRVSCSIDFPQRNYFPRHADMADTLLLLVGAFTAYAFSGCLFFYSWTNRSQRAQEAKGQMGRRKFCASHEPITSNFRLSHRTEAIRIAVRHLLGRMDGTTASVAIVSGWLSLVCLCSVRREQIRTLNEYCLAYFLFFGRRKLCERVSEPAAEQTVAHRFKRVVLFLTLLEPNCRSILIQAHFF